MASDKYLAYIGKLHYISNYFSSVENNAVVNMLYVTGSKSVRIVSEAASTGTAKLETFDGTIVSNNGTEVIVTCMNRNIEYNVETKVYHTPTVTASGTAMRVGLLPGGSGPKSSGGTVREGAEWTLKPNTKYLIRVTNLSGNTADITVVNNFYEVE